VAERCTGGRACQEGNVASQRDARASDQNEQTARRRIVKVARTPRVAALADVQAGVQGEGGPSTTPAGRSPPPARARDGFASKSVFDPATVAGSNENKESRS
jgi:hypothetical protein